MIKYQLSSDLDRWANKFSKPLMITEYGAEAIPGIHCVSF